MNQDALYNTLRPTRRTILPLEPRFWSYVAVSGGCWPWLGGTDDDGYGQFLYKGNAVRSHRVAWIFTFGEIPNGLRVLHTCDNPPCCNPDHLFLGTQANNNADMVAKGRQRILYGEAHGSAKLTTNDVAAMRRLFACGFMTRSELAAEYNLDYSTVYYIIAHQLRKRG